MSWLLILFQVTGAVVWIFLALIAIGVVRFRLTLEGEEVADLKAPWWRRSEDEEQ